MKSQNGSPPDTLSWFDKTQTDPILGKTEDKNENKWRKNLRNNELVALVLPFKEEIKKFKK